MLERLLGQLGHEPIAVVMPTPEQLAGADLLVVEPAAPVGMVLAQAASIVSPSLPLVSASITVPSRELTELGVVFAAAIVKPYTLNELRGAIELAQAA